LSKWSTTSRSTGTVAFSRRSPIFPKVSAIAASGECGSAACWASVAGGLRVKVWPFSCRYPKTEIVRAPLEKLAQSEDGSLPSLQ